MELSAKMSIWLNGDLNSKLVRQRNQEQVFSILRANDALPVSELSFRTRLSLSTVKTVLSDLEEMGLVVVKEQGASTGGRRPALYAVNRTAAFVGGVSVGYRYLKCGLFNVDGSLIKMARVPIEDLKPEIVAEVISKTLVDLIEKNGLAKEKVAGVGVSQPGSVDFAGKAILSTPQETLKGTTLWEKLTEALQCHVFLMEDINAHIAAEFELGEAKGYEHWIYLLLGSSESKWGIGLEAVNKGLWIRGERGLAGEAAHMVIRVGGVECPCGRRGCWEAETDPEKLFKNVLEKNGLTVESLEELFLLIDDRRDEKDTQFDAAYNTFIALLGEGIANIIHIFNPEKIFIGGEVVTLGEKFLEELKIKTMSCCLPPYWKNDILELTHIIEDGDVLGAASWVIGHLVFLNFKAY